jgi:hypothetical protein
MKDVKSLLKSLDLNRRKAPPAWFPSCPEIRQKDLEHATARLTSGHIGNQI